MTCAVVDTGGPGRKWIWKVLPHNDASWVSSSGSQPTTAGRQLQVALNGSAHATSSWLSQALSNNSRHPLSAHAPSSESLARPKFPTSQHAKPKPQTLICSATASTCCQCHSGLSQASRPTRRRAALPCDWEPPLHARARSFARVCSICRRAYLGIGCPEPLVPTL